MQSKTWNSFSVELPQKPWRASDQNSVSDGALLLTCGNERAEAQRLRLGWNDCGFVDGVEQEAVGSEVTFLGHEEDAWEHFRCVADLQDLSPDQTTARSPITAHLKQSCQHMDKWQ